MLNFSLFRQNYYYIVEIPSLWHYLSVLISTCDVIYFLQGPTEAERKIEELTRQLEEEMEKQEEEGEYFGKKRSHNTRKIIIKHSHMCFCIFVNLPVK